MGMTKIITYKSQNYSAFKKILGNRELSERNVKAIIKNIKTNGLKPTIVIVNEKMEVIDGQHRIEALKRLKLPVLYQIHEGLTLEDCVAMNTSGVNWKAEDYIDSYAEMGNEHYVNLKWFTRMFPEFTATNIAVILNSKTSARVGVNIKHGTLTLQYTGKEAEDRLHYMQEIYNAMPNFVGRKECLFTVLSRVMDLPSVDPNRLKEQMLKYGELVSNVVDIKSCLNKVEDVYNYRKATKVRFISQYYELYEDSKRPHHRKETL